MAFDGGDGDEGGNPWEEGLLSDEEEDDGGAGATRQKAEYSAKDNVLLLIDARGNMFDNNRDADDPRSFLSAALTVAVELAKVKCQRDPNARVGVILMGTRKSSAHIDMPGPGVYVLMPLRVPSVDDIRDLRRWSSIDGLRALSNQVGGNDKERVSGFLPRGSVLPLDNALWEAAWIFNKTVQPQDQKRMWLFTNDDAPAVTSKAAVLQRAKDASNMRASLQLWPLQPEGVSDERRFDATRFWEDVLLVDEPDFATGGAGAGSSAASSSGGGGRRIVAEEADEDDGFDDDDADAAAAAAAAAAAGRAGAGAGGGDAAAAAQQRRQRFGHIYFPLTGSASSQPAREAIARHALPKRTYTRLCFDLMPNVTMAVSVYNTVIPKRKPTGHRVTLDSAAPVTMTRKDMDPETGEHLDRRGTVKFHEIGGTKVFFMENEMKDLKTVTASGKGMKLLAFKPRSSVRGIDTLKHPYFLYPAEREITGSTAAFRALHARMTARDVVAIARMQLRDATEPRIVALYPQLEDVDAAGKQRTPPGFVAVPLPYADDVRLMKPPAGALSGVQATEEQVRKARDIAAALTTKPDLRRHEFRNPQIGKFWAVLEREALGGGDGAPAWDDAVDDSSAPDVEGIREAAGPDLQELVALTGLRPDGDVSQLFWPTASKPAPSGSGVGAKRKRVADDSSAGAGAGAGAGEEGTAAKRARAPKKAVVADAAAMSAEEAAVASEFKGIWRSGGLASLTIPKLKTFCVAFGLKQAGKKDEIVARVEEHLQRLFPDGPGADVEGGDAAGDGDGPEASASVPAKVKKVASKARSGGSASAVSSARGKGRRKAAPRRKGRADEWEDSDASEEDEEEAHWSEGEDSAGGHGSDSDGGARSRRSGKRTARSSASAPAAVGASSSAAAAADGGEREWSEDDD